MRLLTALVLIALAIVLVFSLLNWSALVAPTTLSLGFSTVTAPLGLVLLGGCAAVTAALLVFIAYQQARALVDARRWSKELQQHRELADKAEQSRFMELRAWLEGELRGVNEKLDRAVRDRELARGP